MTVIQLHPYGRGSGICPECHRETGNVAKHVPACRARYAAFYAESDEKTWVQIERAAAHSWFVPPAAYAFTRGVTDLDVARVFLHLERGREIAQGGPARWLAPDRSPLNRTALTRTVDEMIRTGLARAVSVRLEPQIVSVHLQAAPVHLRAQERSQAVCEDGAVRLRLVDHPDLADCSACLDQVR